MGRSGFPGGAKGKESACQCRRCKRHGLDPWVRKIPWSRKWQPAPVCLPGKFHGQRSLAACGVTTSWMWLSSAWEFTSLSLSDPGWNVGSAAPTMWPWVHHQPFLGTSLHLQNESSEVPSCPNTDSVNWISTLISISSCLRQPLPFDDLHHSL